MATAREFLIIIRLSGQESDTDRLSYLSRIDKNLRDQGFTCHQAGKRELQLLLGVYYEQNVTTDYYEDYDGGRWILTD